MLRYIRSVLRDSRGSVVVTFALVSVPLILFAGFMVDYTRMTQASVSLQNAADATVLALARDTESTTEELKAAAAQQMAAMLPDWYEFTVSSVQRDGNMLTLTATGTIPAGISEIVGYQDFGQSVTTSATWGTGSLEVVMALDNTGSMASFGRMEALKDAADALLGELAKSEQGLVKVGIVPFEERVRVPTSFQTASWLKDEWWVNMGFWSGCITDRDKDYDVGDEPATTDTSTQFRPSFCSTGLTTIEPLTDNFDTLYSKVDDMNPDGYTNITIGLVWGLGLLSPHAPYTEAEPFGTEDLSKIIVLMTDGDNTRNRWDNSAAEIDPRTALACQTVKDAGVELYTIRLQEGNETLLEACASSSDTYYDVENVSDLAPTFKAIGEELTSLYLSE